jgi:sugar phosphate isomerase/epimerase
MAPFAWILDIARRAITNRYVLAALVGVALFVGGYFKGVMSEREREADQRAAEAIEQAKEVEEAEAIKQELEVAHDNRVRKILSRDVPDADAARMLSSWPDKETAPR